MKRLDKGEAYRFINFSTLKLCVTNDWHFGSDDEKFAMGNYFPDRDTAQQCYDEVLEYAQPMMEKCESRRHSNIRTFLKECRIIADALKDGKGDDAKLKAAFISAWDAYNKEKRANDAMEQETFDEVKRIIRKYNPAAE